MSQGIPILKTKGTVGSSEHIYSSSSPESSPPLPNCLRMIEREIATISNKIESITSEANALSFDFCEQPFFKIEKESKKENFFSHEQRNRQSLLTLKLKACDPMKCEIETTINIRRRNNNLNKFRF